MLRPRSALQIALLAEECFERHYGGGGEIRVLSVEFGDLLFAEEFPRKLTAQAHAATNWQRAIQNMVMGWWELSALSTMTDGAMTSDADRETLFLRLTAALLRYADTGIAAMWRSQIDRRQIARTLATIELDGWTFAEGRFRQNEENVFDVEEQAGALVTLYTRLGLERAEQIRHDIKESDEHYVTGHWGDCVKHARDIVEVTALAIARARVGLGLGTLPNNAERSPVVVRNFLQEGQFLDLQEREFLDKLYALVSRDGGHANMAEQESARILRQQALTQAHFLLLRFERLHPPPAT